MPGLYIHSRHIWGIACDARDRAIKQAAENRDAWTSDTTVAIVLAAAATEAFVNELAESVQLTRNGRDAATLLPALRAFAEAHEEVESGRGSLTLKYLIASQTLSGIMFNKGTNPFQDFALLITLRNDLMHLKPKDQFAQADDGPPSVRFPGYITSLQQRGLARNVDPPVIIMSWFNALQTAEMAVWACETAKLIILAVLSFIPDDPVPGRDPSFMIKQLFRGVSPSAPSSSGRS